jgi:ribosome recycling factor
MDHEVISDLKKRMEASIHSLKHSLNGLRTGRASMALLEPVKVEAYGQVMPINQVGSISVPEAKLITVQVWDAGLVQAVEKAIYNSGLGLNPMSDGQIVRVPLPDLSEQRRKELSKKAHEYGEQGRISIRNIRRDGMEAFKKLEKEKHMSEDDYHSKCDDVQKITDEYAKKIDQLVAEKEKEIMTI